MFFQNHDDTLWRVGRRVDGGVGGKPEVGKPSVRTVWTSYESQKCQP